MSKLFCVSPGLRVLERQMQQPPGYRPRGYGICVMDVDWRSRGNYSEIVDCVISRMQMEHLKKRVDEIFCEVDKELIFRNPKHRNDFYSLLMGKRTKTLQYAPGYAAAVFLLSADEILWEKVRKNVLDTGIYFDRVRLGGVTLEQYILFHAAKDVYSGTKHIRLSELTDRELIPDEILRLIVNAFVIEKCGVEIVKQEVDALKACLYDRSLKTTLTPIVAKLSDMRIVNAELEYMVMEPRKEFITMVVLVVGNIPLLYFLNKDWYHTLMHTVVGQIMLSIAGIIIFVSTAHVIRLTKPIEYRS